MKYFCGLMLQITAYGMRKIRHELFITKDLAVVWRDGILISGQKLLEDKDTTTSQVHILQFTALSVSSILVKNLIV